MKLWFANNNNKNSFADLHASQWGDSGLAEAPALRQLRACGRTNLMTNKKKLFNQCSFHKKNEDLKNEKEIKEKKAFHHLFRCSDQWHPNHLSRQFSFMVMVVTKRLRRYTNGSVQAKPHFERRQFATKIDTKKWPLHMEKEGRRNLKLHVKVRTPQQVQEESRDSGG